MRCEQLSQNLVFFFFSFLFLIPWKSPARRVWSELMPSEEPSCLWRSTERSPKETCTFPGNLLLHSKNSESISIWRSLQAEEKKRKKHIMNQMQALQDSWCDRPTGNSRFLWGALPQHAVSLLTRPYQEQENDNGWKRRDTNPWVHFYFMPSIQFKGSKSLSYSTSFLPRNTVLPYAGSQAQRGTCFPKHSCQILWQVPGACLAHLLVLAMGVARSAHVNWQ